ncbi:MAG: DUF4093 domain-containing protein [Firmicutes bacterium]|nr:DUF4093 domain-containing protein [Bacillota bacterium]
MTERNDAGSGDLKKLYISRPIIVEGKFDRERLSRFVVGTIITTDGFAIFNRREKLALIRRMADVGDGIIILTDSDGAGGVIRSYITSAVPKEKIAQLYIPRVKGKEKRKKNPSREGTLGVEGIDDRTLYRLLLPFSSDAPKRARGRDITKADFYAHAMSGCEGAEKRRDRLAAELGLPSGMTPNALLSALNVISDADELEKIIRRMDWVKND